MDIKNFRLQVVKATRISSQNIHLETFDINDNDSASKTVILEGVWVQNHIVPGTVIHLIKPDFDEKTNTYSVNNSTGFIVVEPDKLITPTLIASSLFCERKTWLDGILLGQIGTNRAMLVGTLVHEVFQHGVRNKIADIDQLTEFLDSILDDATVMLQAYSVEVHLKDIREEAISYISSVKQWIDNYMVLGPCHPLTDNSDLQVKIEVKDIEEEVMSKDYGLRGRIDVTGSVRIHDRRAKTVEDKTIPLELKTGNPNLSASHAAQVSLYSMMIEEKYPGTNQGFVIYLKGKAAMHNVALRHSTKRDLIQRRNQINHHLKSFTVGPEMLNQPRICKNCERLTECVLMSNLYEPGAMDSYRDMKSLEKEAIGHLDDRFMRFFRKYHEKLAVMQLQEAPGSRKPPQISIGRRVLVKLLERDDWRADRVRQLILDPKSMPVDKNLELSLSILNTSFEDIAELSARQQKSVVQAASTDSYYILTEEFEPGQDKMVSVLTRVIRSLNRSVLIVAQEVDSLMDLMRRLQRDRVRFTLIDDGKSIRARHQFAGNHVKVPQGDNIDLVKKFDAYIRLHEQASVVITSLAMSIGGLVFLRKTFDYCIIYNCDTTDLLMGLSPMFCSDRYILLDIRDKKSGDITNDDCSESLGDHFRERPLKSKPDFIQ